MRIARRFNAGARSETRGFDRTLRFNHVTIQRTYHVSSLSVVTGSCLPSTAATTACHGKIAHFTRAGNLCTPANTANLPRPSLLLPVVTISCTLSNSAFTSAFVLPFNESVRIEADAFEMAQPEP